MPPHLRACEGVEHLVFQEEPQPLPLPLALLPALQAAANHRALGPQRHLVVDTRHGHTQGDMDTRSMNESSANRDSIVSLCISSQVD